MEISDRRCKLKFEKHAAQLPLGILFNWQSAHIPTMLYSSAILAETGGGGPFFDTLPAEVRVRGHD